MVCCCLPRAPDTFSRIDYPFSTFFLALLPHTRQGGGDQVPPISTGQGAGPLSLHLLLRRQEEGGTSFLRSVVRVGVSLLWCVVGVVGSALGRINLPQHYSHTGGDFHSVSELMATCACRSFRSAALPSRRSSDLARSFSTCRLCPSLYTTGLGTGARWML
jgi:hypothetical protein